MVNLLQLVSASGPALLPITPAARDAIAVTGVHICELRDPTRYLEGGELLLTTGMSLPSSGEECVEYIERLASHGVSALALGLGPSLDAVPDTVLRACERRGLALLVVPPEAAFAAVTRAYWELLAATGRSSLVAQLGAQATLVREAAKPSGVPGMLSLVARSIGGWAAYVPSDGGEPLVRPTSCADVLPELTAETRRLTQRSDIGSAAFPLHGQDVTAHSITTDHRVHGVFAVGAPYRLAGADRQLILTAAALLGMRESSRVSGSALDRRARAAAARLLADGRLDAAQALLATTDLAPLPARLRVFAAPPADDHEDPADVSGDAVIHALVRLGHISAQAAERSLPPLVTQTGEGTVVFLSVPEPTDDAATKAPCPDADIRGAISDAARLTELAPVLAETLRRARESLPGQVVAPSQDVGRGHRAAEALMAPGRSALMETALSYVRRRGSWEAASRELGVHRNTVRNRIRVIREELHIDLDDPDVSAELWIALRRAI